MKTSRIKVTLPTLLTRIDAECAMTELATVANAQRKIIAQRDAEILKINERCAPELAACDEQIKSLTVQLQAWAEANPAEFGKRKSLELTNGLLGFRTGTPKLALLSRAFTWDKVLQLLNSATGWASFIRTKAEVDKDAILGQHSQAPDKQEFSYELRRFGLKVVQDESFFIEPSLTNTTARQTTETTA